MEISTPLGLRSSLRNTLLAWSFFLLIPAALAQDLFPDKALEAAVRREVFEKRYNAEPLTLDDVKSISQVVAKGKGIKSLEGLQNCKALTGWEGLVKLVAFLTATNISGLAPSLSASEGHGSSEPRRWPRYNRACCRRFLDR